MMASSTGNCSAKHSKPSAESASIPIKLSIRDYGYLRVGNWGEPIKLNWRSGKKKDGKGGVKLFSVAVAENLIQVKRGMV